MSVKVRRIMFIAVMLALVPVIGLAQTSSDEHLKQMRELGGQMAHPVTSQPFYQERTFLVLVGLVFAGAGLVGFRVLRRRWRLRSGPVGFVNEAVLVVDIVNSTHLATHYGNGLAMRAMTLLEERTLAAAENRGLAFAKNTGDGCFMTFPSVAAAVQTAIDLLKGLRDQQPDISPGPPLAVRAGISYGEIVLDARGARHGAAINKAFRLEGLTPERFARVEGEHERSEISDRNRIFLDEDAAQELRSSEISIRAVGFCKLKGFSGLHQVFEVLWLNPNRGS